MWKPWRRVSTVVVRKSGLVYMGRRQAEVIAVQRGSDVWVGLLVLVVLVAAWGALIWWR